MKMLYKALQNAIMEYKIRLVNSNVNHNCIQSLMGFLLLLIHFFDLVLFLVSNQIIPKNVRYSVHSVYII